MAEKTLEEMRQAVAEIREKMAAAAREAAFLKDKISFLGMSDVIEQAGTRRRCSCAPPARPARRRP